MTKYENDIEELKDGRYLVKHNMERITRLYDFVHECARGSHFYVTKGDFLTTCLYLAIDAAMRAEISKDSLIQAISFRWEEAEKEIDSDEIKIKFV